MPKEALRQSQKSFQEWKQAHGPAVASRMMEQALIPLLNPSKEKHQVPKVPVQEYGIKDVGRMIYGADFEDFLRFGSVSPAMQEAGEVTSSLFTNINNAVVLQSVLEGHEEESESTKLVGAIPVLPSNIVTGGNRGRYEEGASIDTLTTEGVTYNKVSLSETYTTDPALSKSHVGMEITREALREEQIAGGLVAQANAIGKRIFRYKRDRLLAVMYQRDSQRLGASTVRSGVSIIKYVEDGVTRDTYYLAGDAGPWTNELASNELVNYTDLDAANALLKGMVDPASGERISVPARHIAVMPAKSALCADLISSIQKKTIESVDYSVSNPYGGLQMFELARAMDILTSGGDTADETEAKANLYWLMGDFTKAFGFLQFTPENVAQPVEVTQDTGGGTSSLFWSADVLYAVKAVWIGNPFIKDPRYVVMSYDTQTANAID